MQALPGHPSWEVEVQKYHVWSGNMEMPTVCMIDGDAMRYEKNDRMLLDRR